MESLYCCTHVKLNEKLSTVVALIANFPNIISLQPWKWGHGTNAQLWDDQCRTDVPFVDNHLTIMAFISNYVYFKTVVAFKANFSYILYILHHCNLENEVMEWIHSCGMTHCCIHVQVDDNHSTIVVLEPLFIFLNILYHNDLEKDQGAENPIESCNFQLLTAWKFNKNGSTPVTCTAISFVYIFLY